MIREEKSFAYFTRYPLRGRLGGGGRRALQIIYEFGDSLFSFYSSGDFSSGNYKQSQNNKSKTYSASLRLLKNVIKKCLAFFLFYPDYFKWEREWRSKLFWFWCLSQRWIKESSRLKEKDVVLIEDPYFLQHFINHLKKRGIRIIAIPQNIESLFVDHCQGKNQLDLLGKEIYWLRQCELVVTISREETFFLVNKDINVLFHPYYPPKVLEERFLNIRKKRYQTKKENFLLLGNAGNQATKKGMIELISIWKIHIIPSPLLVIGYNTEGLRKYTDDKIVVYKGPVKDNELDDLLTTVKGVLCYQKNGPGALTRVAEMLIANIPVIANVHGSRSYSNMSGIFEFHGVEDLVEIIKDLNKDGSDLETNYRKPEKLGKVVKELNSV
jgi:hypothetical protein